MAGIIVAVLSSVRVAAPAIQFGRTVMVTVRVAPTLTLDAQSHTSVGVPDA
jgi:hypothetical protein